MGSWDKLLRFKESITNLYFFDSLKFTRFYLIYDILYITKQNVV